MLICPPKCNRGLEHGQPAQRTVSKVIFEGFPWVFDPSWSQSCQNGFPIVQLMFLYEARARARARLVQEHQLHNWDPILASLGPGGLKNLRKPLKVNVNPSKTTKKDHHICQTQVFGPRTWVWARCGHFWGCFGRGLNQTPGFGPDVVIFVLILLGEVHTKSDHIWPKPILVGPKPGRMCSVLSVLVGKADGLMSIAGSFWVPFAS